MPKYRVTAPDGKTYEVSAPDGASQAEVMAFAQEHYGGGVGSDTPAPVAAAAQSATTAPEPERPGLVEGALQQFGADARSVARGIASIPDIVAAPLTEMVNRAGEKPRTIADLAAGREPGRYFPKQDTFTELADRASNALGLPTNEPGMRTAALEGAAGAMGSLGAGAALKAAPGVVGAVGETLAAQPWLQMASGAMAGAGAEGAREAGAGPLAQLATGFAGGLAPGIASIPGAVARAAKNPELAKIVKDAGARGIPIRPTAVDSPAIDRLRGLPLTGSKGRYSDDVAAFNDQLAETIGAPRGTPIDKVYPAAVKRASNEYADLASRYDFTLDPAAIRKLVTYRNTKPELGGAEPAAAAAIDEFLNEAASLGTGKVPGDLFKKLDTQLGKVPYKSESYRGLKSVQDDLRQQYKAGMSPDDSALWDDLQRRYGDLKTVERLYAKSSGKPIDPKALLGAVTGSRGGKARKAMGTRGELGTMADIGQRIHPPAALPLGATLPVGTLAAGSGVLIPSTATPLAALAALANIGGRIADSQLLTRFLTRPARKSTAARKAAASAAGSAAGANSQRKKKED